MQKLTTHKKIYVGAVGVVVTLGIDQDLTLSTKREIWVKKPDGSEVTWTADGGYVTAARSGQIATRS